LKFDTLANIAIGIAVFLYAVPLQMTAAPGPMRGEVAMGWAFGLGVILFGIWVCLGFALAVATAGGALDWLGTGRGAQFAILAASCLAMLAVTWLSGIMREEPAEAPWAERPFLTWALYAFPPLIAIVATLMVNPRLSASLPSLLLRLPLGAVAGASLLVVVGMLGEWMFSIQMREQEHAVAVVAEADERTKTQLAEIPKLDPEKDFGQLLGYTNRFHDARIRALAVEKLRTNPNFESDLASALRNNWRMDALIYLDANDAPDNKAIAEPARDAMFAMADEVRDLIKTESTLHPDSFDYRARLVLSVADKLHGLGVDYVPAVRAFRNALDEPRSDKPKANCTAEIDKWLRLSH
jgi:hypothetical protein